MSQDPAREPYDSPEIHDLDRLIEAESIFSCDITRRAASEQNRSSGGAEKFVPRLRIEKHFDQPENGYKRVKKLLGVIFGPNQYKVSPKDLAENCSRVFCILIQIGRPKLIEVFVNEETLWDKALPFYEDSPPHNFPKDPTHTDLLGRFIEHQWRFCALKLGTGRRLNVHRSRILPFEDSEPIGGGGTSFVHKVKIHPDHDGLLDASRISSQPSPHWYVIKTFKRTNALSNFERESDAFHQVTDSSNQSTDGLIEFYGGFAYRDTFNIVLEYADAGTLEDLFKRNQPPTTGEGIISFWSNLFEIIKGICQIHEQHLHTADSGPGYAQGSKKIETSVLRLGWHQDVKPNNILVLNKKDVSNTSPPSPFSKSFKIADLGQCHFKTILAGGLEEKDFDTFGTQTYGAPECYQMTPFSEHRPNLIKRNVDIWSLGCVFAEAYVWVVKGWEGLQAFRETRRKAISAIDAHRELKLGDCFHDGHEKLVDVESYLEGVKRDFKRGDYASGRVLEGIIYPALHREPSIRPSAKTMEACAGYLLQGASLDLQRSSVVTPPTPISPQNQTSAFAPPESPPISSPLENRYRAGSNGSPRVFSRELYSSPQGTQTYNTSSPALAGATNAHVGSLPPNVRQLSFPPFNQQQFAMETSSDFASTSQAGQDRRIQTQTLPPSIVTMTGPQQVLSPSLMSSVDDPFRASQPRITNDVITSSPPAEPISNPLTRLGSDVPIWPLPEAKAWRERKREESSMSSKARTLFTPKKKDPETHSDEPNSGLLNQLKDRDHVFFIDDSTSMRPYWEAAADLADLLVYITKRKDPNGVELYFLSANKLHGTYKDSSRIRNDIRRHGANAFTSLTQCFDDDIRRYAREVRHTSSIPHRGYPLKRSIYVLTDGVLGNGVDSDGHDAIRMLVNSLVDARLPRGQIGIQFIRFGDDAAGKRRLRELDELGLSLDLVDTEPATENVYKMLLGAINERFDNAEASRL